MNTRIGNETQLVSVDVDEVSEVIDFLDAHTRLEEFKARNSQYTEELNALAEEYNTALQNADKAVRARGVSCGPWEQLTPQVKYDAEKLYSAVGREDFVRLGGVVRTVTEYVIDRPTIEAAIASGRVPQQIVELVRSVVRKYKTLPRVEIP